MPATVYDSPQPYFLYAGLVFVPLTEPYLHEWGDDWMQDAPHELVHLALSGTSHSRVMCVRVHLALSGATRIASLTRVMCVRA